MKKEIENELEDDLRPEYGFSKLKGGVRGKYAERYQSGTNLVLLDPDVARAFPTEESVNEALRLLIKIAQQKVEIEN
jgi:hypothetical protein